jgi:hypothetical protein
MRLRALRPILARTVAGLGLALSLGALAGCGGGMGKVSGMVTYNGQPVPGGQIAFRHVDGKYDLVTVGIDGLGRYWADLPSGEVMVLVDNRGLASGEGEQGNEGPAFSGPPPGVPLAPDVRAKLGGGAPPPKRSGGAAPKAKAPEGAGKYVKIPEKYYTVETSGLKFTVTGGEQTQSFDLTD